MSLQNKTFGGIQNESSQVLLSAHFYYFFDGRGFSCWKNWADLCVALSADGG